MSKWGIGASLPRKEDHRFLHGRGNYVGDMRLSGMKELAFVRSPYAHARITAVHKPEGKEHLVFAAADLVGVKPMRAPSNLPGYKASDFPA